MDALSRSSDSGKVPLNHPFLTRSPTSWHRSSDEGQARTCSTSGGSARTLLSESSCPRPTLFGSTDIRERRKIAPPDSITIKSAPLAPGQEKRHKTHQPSSLGPAFVHSGDLLGSSPAQSRPEVPSRGLVQLRFPSQRKLIPFHHIPATSDLSPAPRKALPAQNINDSSNVVRDDVTLDHSPTNHANTINLEQPFFAQTQGPENDVQQKAKQEEKEQIVSEALAFLQEHLKKKAATAERKLKDDDVLCNPSQGGGKVTSSNCQEVQVSLDQEESFLKNKTVVKASEDSADLSVTMVNDSSAQHAAEDGKKSVLDVSIQELSALLLNCPCPDRDALVGNDLIGGHRQDENSLLVDLLGSDDKSSNPPFQPELVTKNIPRLLSEMAVADSSEKTKEDEPELEELEAETGAKEAQGLHPVEDEVLVQGFILSEAHSLMVELLMVETLEELVSPTLASILCGFLNSERGGEIYAGVRPTGEVRGLNISPKDRHLLGERIQALTNTFLMPRPPPTLTTLELLPVQTVQSWPDIYVVRIAVKPTDNCRGQFKVHNLGGGEDEGTFLRIGPGPRFSKKLEVK